MTTVKTKATKPETNGHASNGKTPADLPAAPQHLIGLDRIAPSRWNTRRRFGDLAGLAASIKAVGILQPLVVRPITTTQPAEPFELVAGERRYRAAKLAGLAVVPCTVRELDDDEAREIIVTENLQRQDLHPLEEAAGVAALLEGGKSIDDVAAHLGRERTWVARRAQLTKLAECFRQALWFDPDDKAPKGKQTKVAEDLAGWTVGHFELIAAMPKAAQEQFLAEEIAGAHWHDRWTIDDLREQLALWQRKLAAAPFAVNDDKLPGGACTTCPKRTSRAPDLFDDQAADELVKPGQVPKGDRCLDRGCWQKKAEQVAKVKAQELRDVHGDRLVVISETAPRYIHGKAKKTGSGGSLHPNHLRIGEKKTPGSRPAIVLDGERAGAVLHVKPCYGEDWKQLGQVVDAKPAKGSKGKAAAKRPLAEREAELLARRRKWAVQQLDAAIDDAREDDQQTGETGFNIPRPESGLVLALAAKLGTFEHADRAAPADWEWIDKVAAQPTPENALNLLWWRALEVMQHRIRLTIQPQPTKTETNVEAVMRVVWPEAERVAHTIGFALSFALTKAEEEFPEPPGWAKEREQGSGAREQGPGKAKRKKAR